MKSVMNKFFMYCNQCLCSSWRDYTSRLVWEHLGAPLDKTEDVAEERKVWASLFRLLPQRPGPG